MKVYLIKTAEYSENDFFEIEELLNSFNGPISFYKDTTDFTEYFDFLKNFNPNFQFKAVEPEKRTTFNIELGNPLSWREFFSVCDKFRTIKHLSDHDFVVLLTTRRNSLNWFSSFEKNKRNIFVHTGDWENFIKCHHKYPVAYEVIANILYILMKIDLDNLDKYLHKFPLGCISDFCQEKSQVILKLRTADICQTCIKILLQENTAIYLITQVLNIFENIRKQTLFRQGFANNKISRLKITTDFKIILPDFGNIEIKLTPRQKSLYILFLKHLEGIRFAEIIDYKQELWNYYKAISPYEDLERMQNSIDILCNPAERSTLNTECSRIKTAFQNKIGNNTGILAMQQYLIIGEKDEKKGIRLDENLIDLPI